MWRGINFISGFAVAEIHSLGSDLEKSYDMENYTYVYANNKSSFSEKAINLLYKWTSFFSIPLIIRFFYLV